VEVVILPAYEVDAYEAYEVGALVLMMADPFGRIDPVVVQSIFHHQ
tara:strand:+ start:388 stop:525 length:138 start_codon:yes stop_codon:yes gene_type:complete